MRVAWIALVAGCGFQSPAADPSMGGAPDSSFDYTTCPASYNVALPGPTRYRLIATGRAAWDHSDTCNADLLGATHLVVLETMPELLSVSGFVATNANTIANNAVWVGGVQLRTALTPRDGWLGFDGAALIDAWDPNEPNDTGGTEADHGEQFVFLENARRLADRPGNTGIGALCECDGKPVATNAAAAIVANRPPT
jgi:hypothetical protein